MLKIYQFHAEQGKSHAKPTRSPEQFFRNLEAIREYHNQSIAEFAQEVGIAKSTLQSVRISGNSTLDTAIRIADGLDLPLDSLVGDGHLPEKVDIIQYLLRSIGWFQELSGSEREETVYGLILYWLCVATFATNFSVRYVSLRSLYCFMNCARAPSQLPTLNFLSPMIHSLDGPSKVSIKS